MEKIRVEDLTFSYDKERNAVEAVSFAIEEGSYTTIIGHNGSGKSTIAKLLIGLLDKDQGHIYVDGEETEIQPVGEAMTGCWMTAGEHQITMWYTPQGFVEGAAISVISLLILVLGIAGKAGLFSRHHRKM